jgi:hypothetical protein
MTTAAIGIQQSFNVTFCQAITISSPPEMRSTQMLTP